MKALPTVDVVVAGRRVTALLDTGCSKSIVASWLSGYCRGQCNVIAVDGSRVRCRGETKLVISVMGTKLYVECIVAEQLLNQVEMILGMDIINMLGGVTVKEGKVQFLNSAGTIIKQKQQETVATASENTRANENRPTEMRDDTTEAIPITIQDKDFVAHFNGKNWSIKWIWKNKPPTLKNKVGSYSSATRPEVQQGFDDEIQRWISEGWLKEWSGAVQGVIPLMAVVQPSKSKVRPVLDFRELNEFVESHTGDEVAVCDETLRRWRRFSGDLKLVDLRSAYLQIHVDKSLWEYQLVQ